MKRSERAVLAQETLEIVERGAYQAPSGKRINLGSAVKRCLDRTVLYLPGQLEALAGIPPDRLTTPEVTVANETTLAAARRLSEDPSRLALLNFASARNPGGGFLGGSQAQEESLARSSALYASQRQCPEFYEHHRASADLLYSHRMIVSPDCPVFRDDDGALLDEPHFPTIITSPAPNAGAFRGRQPEQRGRIARTLRERARLLFVLASHLGVETLVLGAWGCGVFQNDPAEVAGAFAEWLAPARPRWPFRRVVFAVWDRAPSTPILAAFQSRLAGTPDI